MRADWDNKRYIPIFTSMKTNGVQNVGKVLCLRQREYNREILMLYLKLFVCENEIHSKAILMGECNIMGLHQYIP